MKIMIDGLIIISWIKRVFSERPTDQSALHFCNRLPERKGTERVTVDEERALLRDSFVAFAEYVHIEGEGFQLV